jgi:flavin-dependent dehydrogenase
VDGYEFWNGPGGFAMIAPSNDGLTHVATASGSTKGTPEERFDRVLAAYPDLRERVAPGRRRTRFVTYREAPVLFRQAYGPGWALVGDAGFHQGPWNGYGMSHAFRDAERLADAIDEWLSGAKAFDEALGGYAEDRDSWCRPFFENILAIVTALREGRPQDAPWGGELPHVRRWVESLATELRR